MTFGPTFSYGHIICPLKQNAKTFYSHHSSPFSTQCGLGCCENGTRNNTIFWIMYFILTKSKDMGATNNTGKNGLVLVWGIFLYINTDDECVLVLLLAWLLSLFGGQCVGMISLIFSFSLSPSFPPIHHNLTKYFIFLFYDVSDLLRFGGKFYHWILDIFAIVSPL